MNFDAIDLYFEFERKDEKQTKEQELKELLYKEQELLGRLDYIRKRIKRLKDENISLNS